MESFKPKYSSADLAFPLLSHADALKLMKLIGINAVDPEAFEGYSHNFPSNIVKEPIQKRKLLPNQQKKKDYLQSPFPFKLV